MRDERGEAISKGQQPGVYEGTTGSNWTGAYSQTTEGEQPGVYAELTSSKQTAREDIAPSEGAYAYEQTAARGFQRGEQPGVSEETTASNRTSGVYEETITRGTQLSASTSAGRWWRRLRAIGWRARRVQASGVGQEELK